MLYFLKEFLSSAFMNIFLAQQQQTTTKKTLKSILIYLQVIHHRSASEPLPHEVRGVAGEN